MSPFNLLWFVYELPDHEIDYDRHFHGLIPQDSGVGFSKAD